MNPSDCACRSFFPAQLLDHPLWLFGPEWLCGPLGSWPKQPKISIESEDLVKKELKGDGFHVYLAMGRQEPGPSNNLINSCLTLLHLKSLTLGD